MKSARQEKIIELVEAYEIETQDELATLLRENGYNVTQATVSRDIRELSLRKVPASGQGQKYAVKNEIKQGIENNYINALKDAVISITDAENIIVLKTVSGMAMAVAAAIDAANIKQIVGCIAGDDTIMCVVKTKDDAKEVVKTLLIKFYNK